MTGRSGYRNAKMLALALVGGMSLSCTACGHSGGPAPSPSAAVASTAPSAAASSPSTSNDEGARQTALEFVKPGADTLGLTLKLKPTDADYAAVFEGPSADKARAFYGKMWSKVGDRGIGPKTKGQTEVVVVSATTAELKSGGGKAKEFSGWSTAAPHLKDGLTFYKFSFVEPGHQKGMAFDGLVFVNGHWVIFPKPWKAM